MSSVSKLRWLYGRTKCALFQNVMIHPSILNRPGVCFPNLPLMCLSSPSTTAALSTLILSTICATIVVSEEKDGSDSKSSSIFRSFNGWKSFGFGTISYAYCDSRSADPVHYDTTKDKNQSQGFITTASDVTEKRTQRNMDKIQRRMTSIGRFSLASETNWNPSIISVVIELQNSRNQPKFTKRDFIRLWNQRNMDERHPRFHQIVDSSTQKSSGMKEFHSAHTTDVSQHVSESILPMNRSGLQKLIQDMQLKQWDLSDALWHLTICNTAEKTVSQNAKAKDNLSPTLLLFRGHHVLADGASMSAAFADLYDESDVLRAQIAGFVEAYRRRNRRSRGILQKLWKQLLFLLKFCLGAFLAVWYILRLFFFDIFVDDHPWRFIKRQYDHTRNTEWNNESDPDVARVISWSDVASIEQVKWVAETLSQLNNDRNETKKTKTRKISVNDVFIACVTAAMAKQLDYHRQRLSSLSSSSKPVMLSKQKYIHVAVPVHLKGGVVLPNESVGNNIGALVVRVPSEIECKSTEHDDCIRRLHTVSREMHSIKRTPTAILSHITAKMLSYATEHRLVPLSWTSRMYAASNAGSMVVVSNNRGPSMPVHLDGHLVESVYGFVPLPPGVPVGVAVMSYAGRVSCTLSAEPWAVPDGDQFMIWVIEEYLSLVNAAKAKESLQREIQERK